MKNIGVSLDDSCLADIDFLIEEGLARTKSELIRLAIVNFKQNKRLESEKSSLEKENTRLIGKIDRLEQEKLKLSNKITELNLESLRLIDKIDRLEQEQPEIIKLSKLGVEVNSKKPMAVIEDLIGKGLIASYGKRIGINAYDCYAESFLKSGLVKKGDHWLAKRMPFVDEQYEEPMPLPIRHEYVLLKTEDPELFRLCYNFLQENFSFELKTIASLFPDKLEIPRDRGESIIGYIACKKGIDISNYGELSNKAYCDRIIKEMLYKEHSTTMPRAKLIALVKAEQKAAIGKYLNEDETLIWPNNC